MIGAVLVVMLAGCAGGAGNGAPPDRFTDARHAMVASQIERRGVEDARVLDAMRTVPRHEFVPPALRDQAYADRPLPIGSGQTISQPYVVAIMTELAHAGPGTTVLEIGTGSGYQAAVLAATGATVHSIEIVAPLYEQATETLARIGYGAIRLRLGDGRAGWPEAAPFDAIVVTAAAGEVPPALLEQLADGGRLVMPVGGDHEQVLEVHRRHGDRVTVEGVFPVRFVPLVGGD